MITIHKGDCRELLRALPAESVHCVVTSPPYFGLRDYGIAGQIGLEPSPDAYVAELVAVFGEVRRVLRKDGTLWLNLGDSYGATGGDTHSGFNARYNGTGLAGGKQAEIGKIACLAGSREFFTGLRPKNLLGIPWRVAFALQSDGWYLRQDIIWSKPNPMPESVRDRCTKAHEYLFLLSKSERYYYDADAIAESAEWSSKMPDGWNTGPGSHGTIHPNGREKGANNGASGTMRNKRSVWEVATQPFSEAHFATFPPALIEPCIKAGTSEKGCCTKCGAPWVREVEKIYRGGKRIGDTLTEGSTRNNMGGQKEWDNYVPAQTIGWAPSCKCDAAVVPATVLDPFAGAGTTGLVADRLGRDAILIELNPDYAAMIERRIGADAGMFAQIYREAAE